MGRTLDQIMNALPEERRQTIEARADELLAEVEGLKALRALAARSQEQIADSLGIKQPSVHKIERQTDLYQTRIRDFSGSGFETIAGLKVELGLERVDLVGGDGRDDVNEGVDCGSMLGQIEGREHLDVADDGLGHVPGIQQGFILQR